MSFCLEAILIRLHNVDGAALRQAIALRDIRRAATVVALNQIDSGNAPRADIFDTDIVLDGASHERLL